ncbi:hypothetical protein D9619_002264 [Psilocybe cf. subviscida]|uniref:Uncharacterized protein n=1 Tax=Psilocybe cf. subviscida TaxID=2480587 RepID=A0A8H5BEX3_9AGAR|nr:hypothetical protein D9619_002264 [Psilocybe cf. subviscida]
MGASWTLVTTDAQDPVYGYAGTAALPGNHSTMGRTRNIDLTTSKYSGAPGDVPFSANIPHLPAERTDNYRDNGSMNQVDSIGFPGAGSRSRSDAQRTLKGRSSV